MVKKGFPEIKMRGSDCIQDLCPSYSCHAPPCGVWVLLLVPPFWYRKGCCQVPPQPLLTGQVFHLSSHPGGPGSSLQPGHNILNAFSQVLSELTSLLCSHSPGCCWLPVYQGTLLAYIHLTSSHQGLIRRATPLLVYLEGVISWQLQDSSCPHSVS